MTTLVIKQCKNCLNDFTPVRSTNVFCNLKCASKFFRNKYKDKRKITIKKWGDNNKEKRRMACRKWRNKNFERERLRLKKFQKDNKNVCAYNSAKRRADKKFATPKWLSKLQLIEIKEFYKKAKEITKLTGVNMEVDHIIPLTSDKVCGLNVPWNLQIITEFENISKHNKF